jgi:hypothetical protein
VAFKMEEIFHHPVGPSPAVLQMTLHNSRHAIHFTSVVSLSPPPFQPLDL